MDAIVDEHGRGWRWPSSYLALKDLMFEHELLLFVHTLPWPDTAIAVGDQLLWSAKAGKFNGIRLHAGRRYLHIAMSANWPQLLEDNAVRELRILFDRCGVGDWPTPGGLGQALIRRFYNRSLGKIAKPPERAALDLRENLIGGRSELFRPGRWRGVQEEDINSAYPFAMYDIPAGNCHYLDSDDDPVWGKPPGRYAWFFGHYEWYITSPDIPIPILGIRDGHKVTYPSTNRNTHTGWYTKEEVYTAMLYGYHMTWLGGWGWTKTSNAFEPWIEKIDELRSESTGIINKWIKMVAVAAIGRFGMEPCTYKVLLSSASGTRRTRSEKSQYICDCDTGEILYIIDRIENHRNPELLIQIAVKVHADVRLRTLLRAMPYAQEKRLIATNFDAIYYVGEPVKHDISEDIGAWKRQMLQEASFPARRWMLTDGLQKTPGLPHSYAS